MRTVGSVAFEETFVDDCPGYASAPDLDFAGGFELDGGENEREGDSAVQER